MTVKGDIVCRKVFMKNITGPHYLVVFGDVSDSIEKYAYLNSINIIN